MNRAVACDASVTVAIRGPIYESAFPGYWGYEEEKLKRFSIVHKDGGVWLYGMCLKEVGDQEVKELVDKREKTDWSQWRVEWRKS